MEESIVEKIDGLPEGAVKKLLEEIEEDNAKAAAEASRRRRDERNRGQGLQVDGGGEGLPAGTGSSACSQLRSPSRSPPAARSPSSSSPSEEMCWLDMASAALSKFYQHQVDSRHVPQNISQRLYAEAAGVDAALEIKDAVCQKASGLVKERATWNRCALRSETLDLIEGQCGPVDHIEVLRIFGIGLDAARDVFSAVSLAAEKVVQDRIKIYEATLDHLERIIATHSTMKWQPEDRNRLGQSILTGKRRLAS
jgi:hypothetical protein